MNEKWKKLLWLANESRKKGKLGQTQTKIKIGGRKLSTQKIAESLRFL